MADQDEKTAAGVAKRARATKKSAAAGAGTSAQTAKAESAKVRRLSQAHKDAIAAGRNEALVVGRSREALSASRPRPGRKRTTASIEARLAGIESDLAKAGGVERLKLVQERMDLQAELSAASPTESAAVVDSFIAVAASYGSRRGITRAAWRELGVPAAVLRQAGITR